PARPALARGLPGPAAVRLPRLPARDEPARARAVHRRGRARRRGCGSTLGNADLLQPAGRPDGLERARRPARGRSASAQDGCRMIAVKTTFWVALGALAWTHAAYPLAAAGLARRRRQRVLVNESVEPAVTLVVTAHDEEAVIERRLE